METERRITEDGLERTVSVNYVGPYLLTRKLLPLMGEGSRIVNMVSCTYAIGHLDFPDFFLRGKKGGFWRIPIYSNTKLALTLFTIDLASRVKHKDIVVNAADPGIVSTNIITMHMWFDPLTDILFSLHSVTPRKGAATLSAYCWMRMPVTYGYIECQLPSQVSFGEVYPACTDGRTVGEDGKYSEEMVVKRQRRRIWRLLCLWGI